jgi:hypothetical protein
MQLIKTGDTMNMAGISIFVLCVLNLGQLDHKVNQGHKV